VTVGQTIGNQTRGRASSALDAVQAAKTQQAAMCYGTAAFFLVASFAAWSSRRCPRSRAQLARGRERSVAGSVGTSVKSFR